MNIHFAVLSAIATLTFSQSSVVAGVSDFYISSSSGLIFNVDSETLQATQVADVAGTKAFRVNELLYLNPNELLMSSNGGLSRLNLTDGTVTDEPYEDGFDGNSTIIPRSYGLANTQSGSVVTTTLVIVPGAGVFYVGAEYNLNTQQSSFLNNFPTTSDSTGPDDMHLLSGNRYLITKDESILIYNRTTQAVEVEYDGLLSTVSILELDGRIMFMSYFGEMHELNLADGSMSLYGQIQGVDGISLSGATVPAPSSLALLGVTLLASSRRRRTN